MIIATKRKFFHITWTGKTAVKAEYSLFMTLIAKFLEAGVSPDALKNAIDGVTEYQTVKSWLDA